MQQMIEEIKKALFMEGIDKVEEFLGIEPGIYFEKDVYENALDEKFSQMSDEEIRQCYQKYAA